jgi:Mg-chelatase subunit ChlI
MIIGPPGAGKTTALKHSGLVFPFRARRGGGVRGVGGTRNCDWWFTNEAILLDTAGRYTTESDDRDEWLSFLRMLLKYRSKQPDQRHPRGHQRQRAARRERAADREHRQEDPRAHRRGDDRSSRWSCRSTCSSPRSTSSPASSSSSAI